MQEARSKYSIDIEPENAASIDPVEGNLSSEGTVVLHFKRASPSSSIGRINCKVFLRKVSSTYQDTSFMYLCLIF